MKVASRDELLRVISQGPAVWNQWRKRHDDTRKIKLRSADLMGVNLSGGDLRGLDLGWTDFRAARLDRADLRGADLTNANLSLADLRDATLDGARLFKAKFHRANLSRASLPRVWARRANFHRADMREADISNAVLSDANLHEAILRRANLRETNLEKAVLTEADLVQADLHGADLSRALLVEANLANANITHCRVYGVSAWDVKLDNTRQSDLIITSKNDPVVTVDNLDVAQLIYLLSNNGKISDVIDQLTSRIVLVLGRFLPERKATLDAVSAELRSRGYCSVLFDFEKPSSRDHIETVCTLAHFARFVVADFTDAKTILEEVPHIVRTVAVPVVPILTKASGREPVTLSNLRRNQRSVLDTYRYRDTDDLIANLEASVIAPAEAKVKELEG